jgi:hypothetical protein
MSADRPVRATDIRLTKQGNENDGFLFVANMLLLARSFPSIVSTQERPQQSKSHISITLVTTKWRFMSIIAVEMAVGWWF